MYHSQNVYIERPGEVVVRGDPVDPPPPEGVLIRTRRSLISTGTELNALLQRFEPGSHPSNWVHYPMQVGYSNVGEVLAVGEQVTAVRVGDVIATRAKHGQIVPATLDRFAHVPESLIGREEEAAFWGLGCIVQIGVRRAAPALGETVVVVGLGLLGQLAVQYAMLCGARHVVGVDPLPRRREWALAYGATQAVDSIESARRVLSDLTHGRLAETVYDVTGRAEVLPNACTLCRDLGTLLLLGTTGYPSAQHLPGDFMTRGLRIVSAHDRLPPAAASKENYWTHSEMGRLFLDMLVAGRMQTRGLITHRFNGRDAADAYRVLVETPGDAMGVILEWS